MEDWNWFFTALAQCNAAIVGFIGGFIINKILNKENIYLEIDNQIENLLIDAENQKRRFNNRYFDWYNERIRDEVTSSLSYQNLVRRGSGEINYNDIFNKLNFSEYDSKKDLIELIKKDWGSDFLQDKNIMDLVKLSEEAYLQGISREKVVEERDLINLEIVSTEKIIEHVKLCIQKVKIFPNDIKIILKTLISIFLLFIIGVIYPLTFTPTSTIPNIARLSEQPSVFLNKLFSLPGLLLFITTAIFSYLILIFLFKIKSLKFSEDKIRKLELNSFIYNYSPYFKNE